MLILRQTGRPVRRAICAVLFILTILVTAPSAARASASWSAPVAVDTAPLLSISCPSASFCVAADARGDAVVYDGGVWSAPTEVDGSNQLDSVSCPTASFCVAVDGDGNAVTFDGTAWSVPIDVDPGNSLSSVSCPSASFCVAVDTSGSALSYAGGAWSASLGVDPGHSLSAVSCASASFCAAVDTNGNALSYNVGSWSAPVSVDSPHSFSAISCASTTFCLAVDANAYYATLDGGAWSAAQPMVIEQLTSVSCPSASFCTAVNNGNGWAPTYDGSGWTGVQLASAEQNGQLRAVSCASSSFCMAVDNDGNAVVYDAAASPLPVSPPSPVPGSPPVSSSAPVISGSPVSGALVTEAHGSWTNAPSSFSYRWERCDATGANCAAITDATSQAYEVSAADVGHTLRVQEVAANTSGAGAPALSTPTAVVTSEVSALSGAVVATGRGATVERLLRLGRQPVTFDAWAAGHLEIAWYVEHPAARPRRVVIAKLSSRVPAGMEQVMLTATPGHRHLLAHMRHVAIVATGTFTPVGEDAITLTRRFVLRR